MNKIVMSIAACGFCSAAACCLASDPSNIPGGALDLSLHPDSLLFANASDVVDSSVEDKDSQPERKEPTQAEIAEAINNPLSHLWLLWVQNDTSWWSGDITDAFGDDDKVMNTTLIQPIMPVQLTEDWKAIIRPVIPINSFDTIDGFDVSETEPEGPLGINFERETGLGDIVLWTAFSNNYTPPNVFGFGPTIMMDTATDDALGTGKWSAGPMALAFHIGEKWIYGVVAQHWWSFAGDSERDDVNLSDIQPVLRYRLTPETNIGMAPNIRGNWDNDSDDRWSIPIGLGVDTLVKLGPLPVKIGLEAYHYIEQPDPFGPEWQIRLLFVPVVPSPGWSKTPLF